MKRVCYILNWVAIKELEIVGGDLCWWWQLVGGGRLNGGEVAVVDLNGSAGTMGWMVQTWWRLVEDDRVEFFSVSCWLCVVEMIPFFIAKDGFRWRRTAFCGWFLNRKRVRERDKKREIEGAEHESTPGSNAF